jgi:hypothetical protein
MARLASAPPSSDSGSRDAAGPSASVPSWHHDHHDIPSELDIDADEHYHHLSDPPPAADAVGDGSTRLETSPFPPLPPKARLVGPSVNAYSDIHDEDAYTDADRSIDSVDFLLPSAPLPQPSTPMPSAPDMHTGMLPSAPPLDDDLPTMPSAPPLDDDEEHVAMFGPSAPRPPSAEMLPRYERSSS